MKVCPTLGEYFKDGREQVADQFWSAITSSVSGFVIQAPSHSGGVGHRSSPVGKLHLRELRDEPLGVVRGREIERGGRGADALSGVPGVVAGTRFVGESGPRRQGKRGVYFDANGFQGTYPPNAGDPSEPTMSTP